VRLVGGWIARRLAPDCSKIDLAEFPKQRDERRLLRAMGWETANVHLGGGAKSGRKIGKDLAARKPGWLHASATAMQKAVAADWKAYKSNN
jgi:hypothetical protein